LSEKLGLDDEKEVPQMKNLEFIMDIPLQLTVELGRAKMLVRDVLQLNQGSVVELTKLAGEPLDVVVNDKFGIRLLDIVSPNERVEKVL
jgi:flagellar motor switch protein FliN/FliY